MMIHRAKQLRAFTTGCLLSAMTLGPSSQLLASTSDPQEIQAVTSTYQEAPTTPSEFNDVITGIDAGVDASNLITPAPNPIREHTAFLSSMWDTLFDSDYIAGTSYLLTSEWITGPTGMLSATNETGSTLSVDIALSLEILPNQWSFVDQSSLDTLANVSARHGLAWTTMTNADQIYSNIFVLWFQWSDADGEHTLIAPLNTAAQDSINLWRAVVPLMNGWYDDPLNYNIENYDPSILSIWSDFTSSVRDATISAVATVAGVTIGSALVIGAAIDASVIAGGTAAGTALAQAAAAVVATEAIIVVGSAILVGVALLAYIAAKYQELLDRLENAGVPTDGLTYDELVDAARAHGFVE